MALGSILEFTIPTSGSTPFLIASGPDDSLWFTEVATNKIGRITTAGAFTEYVTAGNPGGIAVGPDGALWFTEVSGNRIGRITTGGAITEFDIPTSDSAPHAIAAGPDGNLWFAEAATNKIGRITTTGVFTEYSLTGIVTPFSIVAGLDGALWFTEIAGNRIGRITTAGVITEFTVPTPNSSPALLTVASDGAIWFTEAVANKIGRIAPNGTITEFSIPTVNRAPQGIAAGPDGAIWFTENAGNKIGRIDANGTISEFAVQTPNAGVFGITSGADGNLWFTEFNTNKIAFIQPANHRPVATITDHSVRIDDWTQLSTWISFSDPDANTARQYQFYDDGASASSGYFWTSASAHHAAETYITVDAADLGNVWLRGGRSGGTETIWIRVSDGTDWSRWDSFSFTTQTNNAPSATINDQSVQTNQWTQVRTWLTYSDTDGDAATLYQFWDEGTAANSGYFWTTANAHHPADTPITVNAADLDNVWLRGGQTAGTETVWVRAFDGVAWSPWDAFDFTTLPNTAPTATVSDHTLHINEWAEVNSWVTYGDADGNPATLFQFWDEGTAPNSGYFWTPANAHHPADTPVTVNAANLADTWVRGGQATGTEMLWVRAFDGTSWSAWDSFVLTTIV